MKVRMLLLFVFLLLVFGSSYGASDSLDCNNPCSRPYPHNESTIPPVPEYLKDKSNTQLCRVPKNGTVIGPVIICGVEKLKPECICTFHHIYNESNHRYTACPNNGMKDSVLHMNCSECIKYSVNNAGPCLNGGTINNCGGNLAVEIKCFCPPTFTGKFCQYKNVTRYRQCCREATSKNETIPICDGEQTGKCKDGDFTCSQSPSGDTSGTYPRCDSLGQWSEKHLTNTGTICENRLTMFVLLYMVAKYFKTIGS